MIGIVLCGGQSTRMGSDKGLLNTDAGTWVQTAVGKLNTLSIPVKISVNKNQYAEYSAIFPAGQLINDNDSLKLKGPLCGVLSVHLAHPAEDLLVFACDMLLMKAGIFKELITHYHQHPDAAALVFTNQGEPEPLCGIYTAKALSHIIHLYQSNQLPKHSMKYILEHVNTKYFAVAAEDVRYFQNFNAHSELNGL